MQGIDGTYINQKTGHYSREEKYTLVEKKETDRDRQRDRESKIEINRGTEKERQR